MLADYPDVCLIELDAPPRLRPESDVFTIPGAQMASTSRAKDPPCSIGCGGDLANDNLFRQFY
jgi:hypothetical protein